MTGVSYQTFSLVLSDTAINGLASQIFKNWPDFNYMDDKIKSSWTGSELTSDLVRKQIFNRWGTEEADNYDPKSNCLTFKSWLQNGYRVKKGEKAIKSFIVIEKKDKAGVVVSRYPKRINLFYIRQVESL